MSQPNIRSSTIVSASSQQTNSQMPTGKASNQSEFLNKKIKKEDGYASSKGSAHDSSTPPSINSQSSHHGMESRADMGDPPQGHGLGSNQAGLQPGIQGGYPPGSVNGMPHTSMDPAGPLPNEIFELLNEFWRPNELVAPDTHFLNGKFTRRSPDGSLDGVAEEEKEGEDDITSLTEAEMGIDRNTQKRRYSRLSDGYERLKSVLPSVKDKRRVSKARILDEAINYIQRLESITNVLKREHEKRLSMLNGANGFFPDYSVQPYMRSLFPKQMYPPSMGAPKSSQYPKLSTTPTALPKSPRMKQYPPSAYSSQGGMAGSQMATDYNYNSISSYSSGGTGSMYGSSDPSQMMNGDTSPITNTPPYSACSLSPGTPTTYQNGGSTVNNSWPYQGCSVNGYNDSSSSQLSNYSPSRPSPGYGGSSGYSSLQSGLWSSMGIGDGSSQVVPHADHSMKVG